MSLTLTDLLTAIALIFVIEGLIYALIPDRIKQLMVLALATESRALRGFGLGMAIMGAGFLWLFEQLY